MYFDKSFSKFVTCSIYYTVFSGKWRGYQYSFSADISWNLHPWFCLFLGKLSGIFLICYEIIMYLHDQSQKIAHFASNVLFLDFIDSPQNHCPFHLSPANIVHILEKTFKEILYIKYPSWKQKISWDVKFALLCQLAMKWSCILVIGLKNSYFINFHCNFLNFYYI